MDFPDIEKRPDAWRLRERLELDPVPALALRDLLAIGLEMDDPELARRTVDAFAQARRLPLPECLAVALREAAFVGAPKCCEALLGAAGRLTVDSKGRDAAMHAARFGRLDCLEILLPKADLEALDEDGRDVSRWAKRHPACEALVRQERARREGREIAAGLPKGSSGGVRKAAL